MDLAFLTEMSNLSPPIIHPPPSYFQTAPPQLAGQFSFGLYSIRAVLGLDASRLERFSVWAIRGSSDPRFGRFSLWAVLALGG